MQRKFISRRSFLKCAGVGAVTAAAAGLLAGCGGSDSSSVIKYCVINIITSPNRNDNRRNR